MRAIGLEEKLGDNFSKQLLAIIDEQPKHLIRPEDVPQLAEELGVKEGQVRRRLHLLSLKRRRGKNEISGPLAEIPLGDGSNLYCPRCEAPYHTQNIRTYRS